MKFQSRGAELAVVTLVTVLVIACLGIAYRVLSDRWPSLGFWFVGGLLYFLVALPAVKRGWKKTDDGKQS
jgi:hypothetical protein